MSSSMLRPQEANLEAHRDSPFGFVRPDNQPPQDIPVDHYASVPGTRNPAMASREMAPEEFLRGHV